MPKLPKVLCGICKKRLNGADSIALTENPITRAQAKRAGLVPLSTAIKLDTELLILDGMINDAKATKKTYALVKTKSGYEFWHSTRSIKV